MKLSLLLVLVAALLISASALGDDVKDELKKLQGKWSPISAELGGTKLSEEQLKAIQLTLEGEKYTVKIGDISDLGTIEIDPSKTPRTMDIIGTEGPNKGKTIPAIYEVSGDTLKVCYSLDGKDRPTEFKAGAATKVFLVVYKRV